MPQDENRLTILRSLVKKEEEKSVNATVDTRSQFFISALSDRPDKSKVILRDAIAADVEAFLSAGGRIETLPSMDKFEMSTHVGYEIKYGSAEGRRHQSAGRFSA